MKDTAPANGPQHGAECTNQSHLQGPAAPAAQAALIAAGLQAPVVLQVEPPAAVRQQGRRAVVGWQLPWHLQVHHRHQGQQQLLRRHVLHCCQSSVVDQPALQQQSRVHVPLYSSERLHVES